MVYRFVLVNPKGWFLVLGRWKIPFVPPYGARRKLRDPFNVWKVPGAYL
jgi:hypothetical protein